MDQNQILIGGIMVLAFLLGAVGLIVAPMLKACREAPARMAEEIRLLNTNPAHRVAVEGSANVQALAQAVNAFADQHQQTVESQAAQIQQAQAKLEDEKNKLAALISDLTEGVVVCNMQGQMLLYNPRAQQLLSHDVGEASDAPAAGFVGLGRSIFGVLDREVLVHAAQNIIQQHEATGSYQVLQQVVVAANGRLLRVRLIPLLTQQDALNGFILSLEDVSQLGESSRRQYQQIDAFVKTVEASLVEIEAKVERLQQAPTLELAERTRLQTAISTETARLKAELGRAATEYVANLKLFDWRMAEILGTDLLLAIQRAHEAELDLEAVTEASAQNLWLRVDSGTIVWAVGYILNRLKAEFGLERAQLRLSSAEPLAAIELGWPQACASLEQVRPWQEEVSPTSITAEPVSVAMVTQAHGGRVEWRTDAAANLAYMRLLLPTTPPLAAARTVRVVPSSRPEFYDFDLFQLAEQTPELDQRPLSELIYTVFDTETTGLNPSEGDEIISIGATRIVNGRLLRQEVIDQLVDPGRSMSAKSIEITGISPDMLQGQPAIEQALPRFHEFARETVLVAHNAAFDMRFLQLKEAKTGLKFSQPVLDTLLLSAVIHPHHDDHNLEVIADRLGIDVIGRHSALGDAIVTGEVFLKLVSLLADKGIVTLGQARQVEQETFMARLNY